MEIQKIAIKNAKKVKIFNIDDIEELNKDEIDLHDVYLTCKNGKFKIIHNNHEIGRVSTFKKNLNLNFSKDTNFCVKLSLHDSWNEPGILAFGKRKNADSVLFPDLYQLMNYYGNIDVVKKFNTDFEQKLNKIIFLGASTGTLEPNTNERINRCIWSLKNSWAMHNTYFRISNFVQLEQKKLNDYCLEQNITYNDIYTDPYTMEKQLQYKYILSIDGNSYAWDRPIWVMASNSVLFKYNTEIEHVGWYYDLLIPNVHYIDVTENIMEYKFNFLENNPEYAKQVIKNANNFVDTYCSHKSMIFYLYNFFNHVSSRY